LSRTHRTSPRNLWWTAPAVGALLLTACGGGGGGGGDGDGPGSAPGPGSTDADAITTLWESPPVEAGAREGVEWINRVWITDSALVTALASGVTGYDPDSGEELWRLEPPDGTDHLCAAAPDLNGNGIGALLYTPVDDPSDREYGSCSVVAAVDAGAGEILWSHDLTHPSGSASARMSGARPLTVGEETIAVNLNWEGYFFRFAIDGGEELPEPEVPGGEECEPHEWHHSAEFTVAEGLCGTFVFDTETGEAVRTLPGWEDGRLAGVLPGDRLALWGDHELVVYEDGEDGEVMAEIPNPAVAPTGSAEAVVSDSVLVWQSDISGPYHYAGWDLETGTRLWKEELAGAPWNAGAGGAGGAEDQRLPLVSQGDEGGGNPALNHLAWLNPRDGSVSDVGSFPEDSHHHMNVVAVGQVAYAITAPVGEGESHLVAYELPS
jgi:hypothetical protein